MEFAKHELAVTFSDSLYALGGNHHIGTVIANVCGNIFGDVEEVVDALAQLRDGEVDAALSIFEGKNFLPTLLKKLQQLIGKRVFTSV